MNAETLQPGVWTKNAEAALLGGILHGKRLPNLNPRDFKIRSHRLIWKAIVAVQYHGPWISLETVVTELRRRGELESAGGGEYLCALWANVGN